MSKYLDDNSAKLDKLATQLSKIFKDIDGLRKKLLTVQHDDIDSIKDLSLKFTSYYGLCLKPYKRMEGLKKNKQLAKYHSIKQECYSNNIKFVDASADKEAKLFVAKERELRDILEAYRDTCLEGFRECRKIMEMYKLESKLGE